MAGNNLWNTWIKLKNRFDPHILIALYVGLVGIDQAAPQLTKEALSGTGTLSAKLDIFLNVIPVSGMSHIYLGLSMLLISIGMMFKLRYAYYLAIVIVSLSLGFSVFLAWHITPVSVIGLQSTLLIILIFSKKYFNQENVGTSIAMAMVIVLFLFFSFMLISYQLGSQFSPPIKSLSTALYFSIVTISTVGFGDIVPRTDEARLFTALSIILAITIFATSLSTILLPALYAKTRSLFLKMEHNISDTEHYIVIGESALAKSTVNVLSAKGLDVVQVVADVSDDYPKEKSRLIIGDPTQTETLKRANAQHAEAVLAITSDDSSNAFIVLAIKQLNTKVKTIVTLNQASNLEIIKRVNPDMVISLDDLGGELLAMALTQQKIQGSDILGKLVKFATTETNDTNPV